MAFTAAKFGSARGVHGPVTMTPGPNAHSPRHRVMARLAAIDLVLTAITGTVFYWLAFVAR